MFIKKLLPVLAIGIFLLTSCAFGTTVPEPISIKESPISDVKDIQITYDGKNGYLWNGKEKILNTTLLEWLGGENYNVGVWFQREDKNNVYVYFFSGSDCGGCGVHEDDYLIFDKNTKIVSRGILNVKSGSQVYSLFEKGNAAYNLSPDKTKAAYVGAEFSADFSGDQAVYIYDFIDGTSEKFSDLAGGVTLAELGPTGFFLKSEKSLSWDDKTGELKVNTGM